MAYANYNNIGITALAAAVPKNIVDNYQYTNFFPENEVKDIVDKIGVFQRRFASENICSSDLCFAAAEQLIKDNNIDRSEIDLLIFISQTPDYRMPATSILLQHRLQLSMGVMAFDINLGCSAFVYGLSVVYSLMQQSGFRKALLLDGETRSKVYSPKDRRTAFLFGDGGVAALIERDEKFSQSFFSFNSDGSREEYIKISGGGYRIPSSLETIQEKVVDEYGNIRSDEHGYMNGGDVFNFVIKEIPTDFKNLMSYANKTNEDIDYYVFHQANRFINQYLAKKLKLDSDKIPSSVEKYGNTSSVSIPLTIVSELKEEARPNLTLCLSAFGVGMTWASAIINLANCSISEIVEI